MDSIKMDMKIIQVLLLFSMCVIMCAQSKGILKVDEEDFIYIDDEASDYDGSGDVDGDSETNDNNEKEINVDDTSFSGSGDFENPSQTECQKIRSKLRSQNVKPAYIPKCTPSGDFETIQCERDEECRQHAEKCTCWCVNEDGMKLPGSQTNFPLAPDCDKFLYPVVIIPRDPSESEDNEIIDINVNVEDVYFDIDLSSIPPTTKSNEVFIFRENHREMDPLFKTPWILGGIVAASCIALLLLVILILMIFTYHFKKPKTGVYQMNATTL